MRTHGAVGSKIGLGDRYVRNKHRQDDYYVGGIGKNVQPFQKSPSISFSANTLCRHAAQKGVPVSGDEPNRSHDRRCGRLCVHCAVASAFGTALIFHFCQNWKSRNSWCSCPKNFFEMSFFLKNYCRFEEISSRAIPDISWIVPAPILEFKKYFQITDKSEKSPKIPYYVHYQPLPLRVRVHCGEPGRRCRQPSVIR